jgi:hypothetical protein
VETDRARHKANVKFLKVRNPITGEMMLFVQYGPLYGERSAPMAWENTIAPLLNHLVSFATKMINVYFITQRTT